MAPGSNGTRPPPTLTAETTKRQQRSEFFGVGSASSLSGFSFHGSRGDYETYRLMSRDPTLALARSMAKLPIKAATHSFEADDDVPDGVTQAVQDAVDELWPDITEALLWSLEYGWKSCEIIWENTAALVVPARIKPLAVDDTRILVDADTGSYLGVRQGAADLFWGKSLYYGNEVEDQRYYGVSRHENVREMVWGPWKDLMKRMHTYFEKGAGVIPVVRYPIGDGADASGTDDDNYKRAQTIINTLSGAKGICFPFEMSQAMDDAVSRGAKMEDICSWMIDFLEAKAGHGDEFLGSARYYDSLKMRGWLVPERAGIEGQNGTKAEAEVHGDVGVGAAEETHTGICRAVNRQLVDPFLSFNFGPQMKGKVRVKPAPMVDDAKTLVREIVKAVLTNPSAIDVLMTTTDFDGMLDQTGVPKGQEVVPMLGDPNADPDAPAQAPRPKLTPEQQAKDAARSMARIHEALMRGGD